MATINKIDNLPINNYSGIKKAWVIQSKLKTVSPMVAGAGTGDESDKIIQRDCHGNPVLNGSSFIGSLSNYIDSNYEIPISNVSYEYFWGTSSEYTKYRVNKNATGTLSSQSHLRIFPINIVDGKPDVTILDGIKILSNTNVVEDKAKYDYEAINNEVTFLLRMEIYLRDGMNEKDFIKIISVIKDVFDKSKIKFGAFTSTGFGQVEFHDIIIRQFNFSVDANDWFHYKVNPFQLKESDIEFDNVEYLKNNAFEINAVFFIKNAILTGAVNKTARSEKSQYKFNNNAALIGKAVKGAINHRMLRILNTLKIRNAETILKQFTGTGANHNESDDDGNISKLKIDFAKIQNTKDVLQDRIKIDRFTQGTVDGAKYDSEPAWAKDGESEVNLKITIKEYKPWQAALLLHVLKDFWTEDLAIGGEKNVGRGILRGKSASLLYNDKRTELFNKLSESEIDELNLFNQELQKMAIDGE